MVDREHLVQVARKGPEPIFATISGAHHERDLSAHATLLDRTTCPPQRSGKPARAFSVWLSACTMAALCLLGRVASASNPWRIPVVFHVAQRDGEAVAATSFIAEQLDDTFAREAATRGEHALQRHEHQARRSGGLNLAKTGQAPLWPQSNAVRRINRNSTRRCSPGAPLRESFSIGRDAP